MINIEKVKAALDAQPLCAGVLTNTTNGETQYRCAVGALLHGIGVTDEELVVGGMSSDLWEKHGERLYGEYGLTSSFQLLGIILVNDDAAPENRKAAVLAYVGSL